MLRLRAGDPYMVGPYRLVGRLGSGGMGQVYLGVGAHRELVAVKLVHRPFATDPQFRARFRHEVDAAAQVTGPGTAAVVAADPDAPVPWLATEYVPGPALDRAVRAAGPLPPPTLHVLAAGLAATLAAVHAAGLVHRDVKPPNVLLAADGPRLIDMGISRAADATQLSTTGALVGTPAFMSPEQAEGAATGPESDVFSLGAVLAYAALGRGPFGEGNPLVLLRRIADDAADLTGFTGPLRDPVAACLAKRPGQRPTAEQLATLVGPAPAPAAGAPPAAWLPVSVAGLIPSPPDLEQTVVTGLRHAPTRIPATGTVPGAPPPPPARVGRRALLAGGAAALGLAVVGGLGAAVALSARATPAAAPAPVPPGPTPTPTPTPTPLARPAGATARWTAEGVPRPAGALVAAGDAVYVGGGGRVVAVDAASGTVRWRFEAPPGGVGFDPDQVRIAVADGTVYAATRGAAAALDAATGQQRWRVESSLTTGYQSLAGLDVAAGAGLAFVTHGPTLTAFDPASGEQRWQHTVDGNFAVSPTVDGDRVLVTDGPGVDALDAATGRPLWQYRAEGDSATELAVADGLAFLAVNVGGVVAVDTATGAVRWEASPATDGVVPNRPVVADGAVVVLGRDDQVHALEAATGTPRWDRPDRTSGGGTVTTGPATANGLVYAGSENGRVYAVDATSGDARWVHVPEAGYNPVQVLAAAGDTAFVAWFDGRLSALVPA